MRAGWAAGRELDSERGGEGTGTSTPGDVEAPWPAVCVRRRLEPLARAPGPCAASVEEVAAAAAFAAVAGAPGKAG